ncbi:flavoprotein [Streptomyces spinosirectus]
MHDAAAAPPSAAPPFTGRRLLYVGTGALGVMFMPMWLHWLRTSYPEVEIRTVVTRSATRFVTPTTLSVFGGRAPQPDVWGDEPETTAPHVELAHWADTVVVHPATFHFTGRLALGVADTPALLALQCTAAPIALAPALPPGALTSPAWRQHVRTLAERANVTVVPPHQGISMTTGEPGAMTAATLTEVIPAVEALRTRLAGQPGAERA